MATLVATGPSPASATPATLLRRCVLTLAALLIYRLGSHIPFPGLDPDAAAKLVSGRGLAIERVSIFALGVIPLFTAMFVAELLMIFAPSLRRWSIEPRNRETFNRGVLAGGLFIAVLQALGIAIALEDITSLVSERGLAFEFTCVATVVAGTAFLAWLADQITRHGLGSGFWVLFIVPLLANPPVSFFQLIELQSQGTVSAQQVALPAIFLALGTAAVVRVYRARSADRDGTQSSGLAWLWPANLAYFALGLLFAADIFLAGGDPQSQLTWSAPGRPVYLGVLAVLIAGFVFLRERSIRLSGSGEDAPVPMIIAGVLILVLLGGEVLSYWIGIPLPVSGKSLVVITIVMLSLAAAFRQARG